MRNTDLQAVEDNVAVTARDRCEDALLIQFNLVNALLFTPPHLQRIYITPKLYPPLPRLPRDWPGPSFNSSFEFIVAEPRQACTG